MFTIETAGEYEAARKRLEQLRKNSVPDGPEAAEMVALMAAIDKWEKRAKPLEKQVPGKLAT